MKNIIELGRTKIQSTEKLSFNVIAFSIQGGKIYGFAVNGRGASEHAEVNLLKKQVRLGEENHSRTPVPGRWNSGVGQAM